MAMSPMLLQKEVASTSLIPSRRAILCSFAAGLALSLPAFAAQPEFYTGIVKGVAVGGYDPVAYFQDGKATPGNSSITTNWKGVTWRFANEKNRDTFVADPEKYAPQYGGYCAFAVASGSTAKGDPTVWKIVDGKLYLNLSRGVQQQWERDVPGNISRANSNWPKLVGK